MKLKRKIFLAAIISTFQLVNFSAVNATEVDSELAIIAAEQDTSNGELLNPAEDISSENNKKKIVENKPEPIQPVEEKKSPPPEISTEKNSPQTEVVIIEEIQIIQSILNITANIPFL